MCKQDHALTHGPLVGFPTSVVTDRLDLMLRYVFLIYISSEQITCKTVMHSQLTLPVVKNFYDTEILNTITGNVSKEMR